MRKILCSLLCMMLLAACVSRQKIQPFAGVWHCTTDSIATTTVPSETTLQHASLQMLQAEKSLKKLPDDFVTKTGSHPLLGPLLKQTLNQPTQKMHKVQALKQRLESQSGNGQIFLWLLVFLLCLAAALGLMYLLGVSMNFQKMLIGFLVIVLIILLLWAIES